MNWLRGAVKKLSSRPVLTLIFVSNLALGMAGLQTVLSFKDSISANLQQNSREILGADLSVRSRRPLTPDEEKTLAATLPPHERANSLSFYSMATAAEYTGLTQIRAVSLNYPLYGEIRLAQRGKVGEKELSELQERAEVWVYPELLHQMSARIGDEIKIGRIAFRIADVIEKDNAQVAAATSFAPTVMIGLGQVEQTGLVRFGSTVRYQRYFRWRDPRTDTEAAISLLQEKLPDPAVDILGHEEEDSQVGRMIKYLADYIGLVGLVALFLANVGGAFLFRGLLFGQTKDLAVMRTIGVKPAAIPKYLYAQVVICGAAAVGVSSAVTYFGLPLLQVLSEELFPGRLHLSLSLSATLLTFAVGVLFPLLLAQPLVSRVAKAKPAELFGDFQGLRWFRLYRWYHHSLIFALAWLIAVWQANSFFIGSVFTFVLTGAALAIGRGFVFLLRRLPSRLHHGPLVLRWVWTQLSRRSVASVSLLLAIGLSAMMVSLIPQVERNIAAELAADENRRLPGLFLFDIQEDQLEPLNTFLREERLQLNQPSALVRARILAVNGKKFERAKEDEWLRTRESERENRFRNRGVNLTYRSELSDSETLLEGRPFSGVFAGGPEDAAEISVEYRYAERLGLQLGDRLVFDIQGVEVPAEVVNFRHVKWTSFQPNFFIQFQPGVLEEAPKTFIGSVASLSEERRSQLRGRIVRQFPNISMIDVHRLVERVIGLSRKMSAVLKGMSLLCFLCGLTVMFSVIFYQSEERKKESSLLKSLGVSVGRIRMLAVLELAVLAGAAIAAGVSLSLLLSRIFTVEVFRALWRIDYSSLILVAGGAFGAALLIGLTALIPVLRAKPWALLKG